MAHEIGQFVTENGRCIQVTVDTIDKKRFVLLTDLLEPASTITFTVVEATKLILLSEKAIEYAFNTHSDNDPVF